MAEETLYDSEAMRRLAGIELGDDRIPDETTILKFRHLLGQHGLTETIFADVNTHLADKGITLRSGTLVDATIIDVNRPGFPRGVFVQNLSGFFKGFHLFVECLLHFLRRPMTDGTV